MNNDCFSAEPSPNQSFYGGILLSTALVALLFYLLILESIFMFARRRVAVLLLLSHSFAEIFMLAQFVWLSAEIIFNRRVILPWHLDSFLYKFANNSEQAHLLLIALNRAHCIYSPRHYKLLWNKRNAFIFCSLAWLYGTGISVFLNYVLDRPPQSHLVHCIARFTFDRERNQTGQENVQEQIGRWSTLILVFFPLAIYCLFLVQIFCERVCPKAFARLLHQKSHKFMADAQLSDEVSSLGDRIRLLLICFLSTLPDVVVFLAIALMGKDKLHKMFTQSMLIVVMHCNQPLWLILLSLTFRRHLHNEFRKIKALSWNQCLCLSCANRTSSADLGKNLNRNNKNNNNNQQNSSRCECGGQPTNTMSTYWIGGNGMEINSRQAANWEKKREDAKEEDGEQQEEEENDGNGNGVARDKKADKVARDEINNSNWTYLDFPLTMADRRRRNTEPTSAANSLFKSKSQLTDIGYIDG